VATLAQINQMGACRFASGGSVSVDVNPNSRLTDLMHSWQLPMTQPTKWSDVIEALGPIHGLSRTPSSKSNHIHFRTRENWDHPPPSNLQLTVWNGRAILSDFALVFDSLGERKSTLIDASIEVAACAVALQQILIQAGLIRSTPVSDRWLSLTARVENIPPEVAVDLFTSELGPVTASHLPDNTGSLLRIRVPLEQTSPELLRLLDHPCLTSESLIPEGWLSLSPIPVSVVDGVVYDETLHLPSHLESAAVVVLGAGGLGSWAAPLFANGVNLENLQLTLIDGDDSVDEHNLNRQVLYTEDDIGLPKAIQAASRMQSLFGSTPNIQGIHSRLESNHVYEMEFLGDMETISLDSLFEHDENQDSTDEVIKSALDGMEVGLACLDNMNSRTLFNHACIVRNSRFVNAGSQAFEGLVEIFDSNVCMVCRYGEDAARSREIISC
ncbi:MAG: ThiF family adenylyltransferase, partial [Candidatus Thermoplasmatota archaeon]|nr:ThiF family adenylyltransferase [Candidatus Thermoplasmatota archaeon]